MEKKELARRQLDGAIRARLSRSDPVIAATLTFPASQMLRDLNIGNPKSISAIMTEMAQEAGYSLGALWSEFNKNSGANEIKHARDSKVFERANEILDDVDGALMFAIGEYMFMNEFRVSHHMAAFIGSTTRQQRRNNRKGIAISFRDWIDRRGSLLVADSKTAFYGMLLALLEKLGRRLDLQPDASSMP